MKTDVALILAGVSVLLQAIQVWQNRRNRGE